jgi:NAD(P)-dependent dehydrogenase (short-subunit alcohol dehydrogenase family)
MKLSGKIALVTGASRGIGRSVAWAFAREGAGLFLVGHRDESALQQTLRETREMGGRRTAVCSMSATMKRFGA